MKKLSDLEPRCKDCKFWDGDGDTDEEGNEWGWCRHGPGTALMTDEGEITTILPVKRADEWCSFLKPRN